MTVIDDHTPVSNLLDLKIGTEISNGSLSGKIFAVDFEETNNYWEIIFTLTEKDKIYIRKQKTMCS